MVQHPLPECNRQQREFLLTCPPHQRRYHELLFSYGNSAYRYHRRANRFTPTLQDYQEWLEGLPANVQKEMTARGFEACQSVLSFTRYVMEKNDVGMESFIKEMMGEEAYAEYLSSSPANAEK